MQASRSGIAVVLTFTLVACASTPKPPASPTQAASHDMMNMSDHDMASMSAGSHSKTELAFLFPDGNDKGWSQLENGMQHTMAPDVPLAKLAPDVRAQLDHQLTLTLDVVKKYPTVKDAEAAGYRRAGPFIPGLGTHYVGGRSTRSGVLTDDDILHPSTIIYDGTKPDSRIAGFMFMAQGVAGGAEPEGFAGPNDHWHYHTGICLVAGSNGAMEALGFDGSITKTSCTEKHGNWIAATQYLLHVWTVPGYTNPLGVFAHTNPAMTCGDGTYFTDDHDITNACRRP
jgi:hypothetical protein